MTPYTYIEAVFKRILTVSNSIRGNFFVLEKHGQELNSDNLEQLIKDSFTQTVINYPLVAMMPPVIIPKYSKQAEKINITLLFLTTSFYTGDSQIKSPNKSTNTSTHRIVEDWEDMLKSAQDFFKVLDLMIQNNRSTIKIGFDLTKEPFIDTVSLAGNKRLSGVKFSFTLSLFDNCDIVDYTQENIDALTVPTEDIHTHPASPAPTYCKTLLELINSTAASGVVAEIEASNKEDEIRDLFCEPPGAPVQILNQDDELITELNPGTVYHILEFSGIDAGNATTNYSNSIVAIP